MRPEDRARYLDVLEHASLTGDLARFQAQMHARLAATLADTLDAYRQALPE